MLRLETRASHSKHLMPRTARFMAGLTLGLTVFVCSSFSVSANEYRLFDGESLLMVSDPTALELPIDKSERVHDYGCKDGWALDEKDKKLTEYEDKKIGEKLFVFNKPDLTYHALRDLQVDGDRLLVYFTAKGWFQQYSAPTLLRLKKDVYGAAPISTLLTTGLLLGLPLLTPGEVAKGTFGCTDRESVSKHLDVKSSRKTRKGWWIDHSQEATVILDGFQGPLSLSVSIDGDTGIGTVDLGRFIDNAVLTGPTTIRVTCPSCDKPSKKQAKLFGQAHPLLTTIADFRSVREERVRQARLKVEAEARALEAEALRAAAEAELLRLQRILAEERAAEQRAAAEAARLETERLALERKRQEALAEQARRDAAAIAERERKSREAKAATLRNL